MREKYLLGILADSPSQSDNTSAYHKDPFDRQKRPLHVSLIVCPHTDRQKLPSHVSLVVCPHTDRQKRSLQVSVVHTQTYRNDRSIKCYRLSI